MSPRRRFTNINHQMIGSLKEIFFFIMLVSSSTLCIISIAYFQSQFEQSSTMVLYKEIAEDCYPSAICDRDGKIHVVWQSDRKGNWDIYYTLLGNHIQKGFISLTTGSQDKTFPSITEDEKGNIWVAWVTSDLDGSSIHGKILQDQKSWSEEVIFMSKDDNCQKKCPQIIGIDSTRMLLAWISKEGKEQYIRYAVHNNFTGQPKLLSITNNARKVVLGKTRSGKIFALWDSMSMGKNSLYFSLFDDEKETFPEYQPLLSVSGEPFIGDTPSVVMCNEGPSMLFFRNETWNIFLSVESIQEDAGEFPKFSQSILFAETGALEDCPEAIITNEGEIYLFWSSNYTGDNEIFFCHSFDIHDFKERGLQYERGATSVDEIESRFVKNLTMDPNQNNANPCGYFCDDVFFSVDVVGDEIWCAWDSYYWDLMEPNNARRIKYMKTSDGYFREQPVTVVDSTKYRKNGRDDRHPAIVGTEDGHIWLFWHSDRYRTDKENNFEICYIVSEDGGESWNWRVQDEDPFILTGDLGTDICPSVSSIDNKIFVVWQSDRRSGNFDIYCCEFDGKNWSSARCITSQDAPEWNPSIAAYKGWHLASLGYEENAVVAWESKEEGCYVCHFSTLNPVKDMLQLEVQNVDIRYPSACYVSRHTVLKKILQNDLWLIWQYSEHGRKTSNILCKNRSNEERITDDFSHNERPQIIEFDGKVWIFWDSNGDGNGRGIYYKYMYRRDIPFWLEIYSYILAVSWVLFFLDIRSKGGVRKQILELSMRIDEVFHEHVGLRDVIIGIAASLLTYLFLQSVGMFYSYLFG